jgi:hypothetical protein
MAYKFIKLYRRHSPQWPTLTPSGGTDPPKIFASFASLADKIFSLSEVPGHNGKAMPSKEATNLIQRILRPLRINYQAQSKQLCIAYFPP